MLSQRIAAFIYRFKQKCVQALLDRQDLSFLVIPVMAAILDIRNRRMGERHILLQIIAVLQYHQTGHNLRNAGRIPRPFSFFVYSTIPELASRRNAL